MSNERENGEKRSSFRSYLTPLYPLFQITMKHSPSYPICLMIYKLLIAYIFQGTHPNLWLQWQWARESWSVCDRGLFFLSRSFSLSLSPETMATTAPPTKTRYRSPRLRYNPSHNTRTPPSHLTLKCGFCKEVKTRFTDNKIYGRPWWFKMQFKALTDFTDEQRLKVCIHCVMDIPSLSTQTLCIVITT